MPTDRVTAAMVPMWMAGSEGSVGAETRTTCYVAVVERSTWLLKVKPKSPSRRGTSSFADSNSSVLICLLFIFIFAWLLYLSVVLSLHS